MKNEQTTHPFEKTLGAGPYRFVGAFEINLDLMREGRPYIDQSKVHSRFVRGSGTCAHCNHAILNVFQVEIGNGDVFGVGCDCIEKVGLPLVEMDKINKLVKQREKVRRAERKANKGDAARNEIAAMVKDRDSLVCKPHPNDFLAKKGLTLLDYATWAIDNSNDGGIIFALRSIKASLKKQL